MENPKTSNENSDAPVRRLPDTEEEFLAMIEPEIQKKLLAYPEADRERLHDCLVSEASTYYFFASLLQEPEQSAAETNRVETEEP